MKILFTEHSDIDYANYQFPYCIHAIKEANDTYSDIYRQGFLPYTYDLTINDEIYYLARSIRIDLQTPLFNSKQKNVLNKFAKSYENDSLEFELHPKEYYAKDTDFHKWCLQNAKNGFLSMERLQYIISRPYLQQVLSIRYKGNSLAHLFIVTEKESFIHVWYSFYNLSVSLNDFGKWILLKTIEWSQKEKFSHFYIGTCYSKSALYKLTLSPFTAYYNGNEWNANISVLKKSLLNGNK